MSDTPERIDVDQPLWDQSSYIGRFRHFAFITDIRTAFVPNEKLWKAKTLCSEYRAKKEPSDTTLNDIIYAKKLRDSAFQPETEKLMPRTGRMSFYVPASVMLNTAMFTFYKSITGMMLCQIANQTHAAIVNYTNRNIQADDEGNNHEIKGVFICAIVASSMVAIGCRRALRCKGPLITNLIPFCSFTMGHLLNLPIIRYKEIMNGIPIYSKGTEDPLMISKVAGVKGISECLISRIAMSIPCLLFIPTISQNIKVYCLYQRRPWIKFPIEFLLCTIGCLFAIPASLAIFPQCNTMNPELMKMYPIEYEEFTSKVKNPNERVYYNKGL